MEAHVLERKLILPVVPLLYRDTARCTGILHVQKSQEIRHSGTDLAKLPMSRNQDETGRPELVQGAHIPGERAYGHGSRHHFQRRQQISAQGKDAAHQIVGVIGRSLHIMSFCKIGPGFLLKPGRVFQDHLLHAVEANDFSHPFIAEHIVQHITNPLLHSCMSLENFQLLCGKSGENPERTGAHAQKQRCEERKGWNGSRKTPHRTGASRRPGQAQVNHQGN